MYAVFNSLHVIPERRLSHNVLYLEGSVIDDAAANEAAQAMIDLWRTRGYDIVFTDPILQDLDPAVQGGVIARDVFIDRDTVLPTGMVVCGTLTVEEGTTLRIGKGEPMILENLRLGGRLRAEGQIYVCGHTEVFGRGARLYCRDFFSSTAEIRKDAVVSGTLSFDSLVIKRECTVSTRQNTRLSWNYGRLEEGVSIQLTRSRLCMGSPAGEGTTKAGRGVRLIGDGRSRYQAYGLTGRPAVESLLREDR